MYSITVDRLDNLHETLKKLVKEVNEFAWDMRQAGLGVLMPEEIEIKVTLMDEAAGDLTEVETTSGGGKTTTSTTNDDKGTRTETLDITDAESGKQSTQTENNPTIIETVEDVINSDVTTTTHGPENSDETYNGVTDTTNFGNEKATETYNSVRDETTFNQEVAVEVYDSLKDTTTFGPEITEEIMNGVTDTTTFGEERVSDETANDTTTTTPGTETATTITTPQVSTSVTNGGDNSQADYSYT
jgi:hypothetical protein